MIEQHGTKPGPSIHLVDFDGTLSHDDSLPKFLLFAVPFPNLIFGGIVFIFSSLGLILTFKWSKSAFKAALFAAFFKGKTQEELARLGTDFYQQKMRSMLRVALLEQLRKAQKNGETVVLVSASPDIWLRPFCAGEGFSLLCTEFEFVDGRFTGRFATPNCNGEEKALRIQAAYSLHAFKNIQAYGNSKGDEAMYALATKVFKF